MALSHGTIQLDEALTAEALAQVKEVKKARTHKGNDPDRQRNAKTAIGIIGSCVRLKATIENTRHNDMAVMRISDEGADKTKLITGA